MLLLNKYYNSFNLKLVSLNNIDYLSFKYSFNHKNKLIHNIILFICTSIYNNNVVQYKNKFRRYTTFNLNTSNFISNKLLNDSIFIKN